MQNANYCNSNNYLCVLEGENIVGKGENAGYQPFGRQILSFEQQDTSTNAFNLEKACRRKIPSIRLKRERERERERERDDSKVFSDGNYTTSSVRADERSPRSLISKLSAKAYRAKLIVQMFDMLER